MYVKIVLFLCFFGSINCASVEVTTEGLGVTDIPLTFWAKLVGEVSMDINDFVYVFEDRVVYPFHREEVLSGRQCNYTVVYKSNVSTATYTMKVQVYVFIWGIKGWLIAEHYHRFHLQNALPVSINISQSGLSDKAITDSIVATNRSVELSALINGGQHFLPSASINYTWIVGDRRFPESPSPNLNFTFTSSKAYILNVIVKADISLPDHNISKAGFFNRTISAKNEIQTMNIDGNTWLLDGALLHLKINCTGGDSPFWYCYEFSKSKRENYTCSRELIHTDVCKFPITHYFSKNGTHYIYIGIYNDVNFKHKTISVNVYDKVREAQLSFVIIPIVSSILAIIIIVVGIAYHLQQRQRYNITLEVADFDFQHNEDLMEKTFFERLRESLANALKETLIYPCNPCTRAVNYDDLIDDTVCEEQNQTNNNSAVIAINRNPISYGIVK